MRAGGSPGPLDQRLYRARRDRDFSRACRIEHLAGVGHHLINRDVPSYTADAEHVEVGVAQGVKNRQGVVCAGVNVYDNPPRHNGHADRLKEFPRPRPMITALHKA
jgi:hypothetical protein